MNSVVSHAAQKARLNPTLANNVGSGWTKLHAEKCCRLCDSQERLTRHHLVPQAWFMQRKLELRVLRNANANIIPLCEPCHRVVDSYADPVGRLKKRAAIRCALGSNEVAFILQLRGQSWFDREYPKFP